MISKSDRCGGSEVFFSLSLCPIGKKEEGLVKSSKMNFEKTLFYKFYFVQKENPVGSILFCWITLRGVFFINEIHCQGWILVILLGFHRRYLWSSFLFWPWLVFTVAFKIHEEGLYWLGGSFLEVVAHLEGAWKSKNS